MRLRVRAKPHSRSARQRKPIVVDLADGTALEIALAAAPEDGKANKELLSLLAAWCEVPRCALALRSGATARVKIVEITGDPSALAARLRKWMSG